LRLLEPPRFSSCDKNSLVAHIYAPVEVVSGLKTTPSISLVKIKRKQMETNGKTTEKETKKKKPPRRKTRNETEQKNEQRR